MFKYKDLAIHTVEEGDLLFLMELRSHYDVWSNLGNIEMLTYEGQIRWLQNIRSSSTQEYYILKKHTIDRKIGMVRTDQIDFINKSIRVGGDIHPLYQGEGNGYKMICMIQKYCFDYLNIHRIWLSVLETNEKAINLYKKVGFIEEGRQRKGIYRNNKYIDYIMMSLLKEEM